MAQLHSRIPVQNMQRGERVVYDAMAKLPDDWIIFHSCKEDYLDGRRYVHYEADFVVLIPRRGLVVIEVKDWPQIRIADGRWQSRKDENGTWQTHVHSPLEQANIALQKIMRSLARSGSIAQAPVRWPEHRHMAILTQGVPETDCSHNHSFDTLYLCGVSELERLQQRIEHLFVLQQGSRMTTRHMQKIAETLSPSVHFRMSLANYLQEMDASAANLLTLLPALYESTGGIRVEGCAGSGKTVMACAEAARQAAELPRDGRHRMLMLCFNHAMAAELHRNPLLAEQSDILQVSTFHDFCIGSILKPAGQEHLVNYEADGDRLPETALTRIIELLPGLPHYDAIFVDEAQDFRRIWWQIIQSLLIPGGKLYLFADKNQDLYDRYDQLPELPTRLRLNCNLRNAHQIAGFSRAMLSPADQGGDILPMTGAGVSIAPAGDTPQARACEVQRIIRELREKQVPLCDIVVLSPWRTAHPRCSLNLVPELATAPAAETPAQAAGRRAACRQAGATQIFASTIKSFKGQEAAYVIVTDVIGLNESRGFDMKELYTACTRARYGLFIVPTATGRQLVESFPCA